MVTPLTFDLLPGQTSEDPENSLESLTFWIDPFFSHLNALLTFHFRLRTFQADVASFTWSTRLCIWKEFDAVFPLEPFVQGNRESHHDETDSDANTQLCIVLERRT